MRAWTQVGIILALVGGLATPVAAAAPADTVGLVDTARGYWYLRDGTGATTGFYYGNPGDVPFMGDWDCDGVDTPGLYRQSDSYVYLRNSNGPGIADVRFFFGNPGDQPIAGDFDGDGCDTVSIFRPSNATVYLINQLGSNGAGLGAADESFGFGSAGQVAVAADFDGDGITEVGMHDPATATTTYLPGAGQPPQAIAFGNPQDRLVPGDWSGSGTEQLGLYRPTEGAFHKGGVAGSVTYGNGALHPVAGSFGALPGGGSEPPLLPTSAVTSGSSGAAVMQLQQMLAAKGFYRGSIDGSYGESTRQAVMAFHKDNGLDRSWDWQASDWPLLAAYAGPDIPDRSAEPNRVEVDLGKQVAYLVENGVVVAIFPVSSGNGARFGGRNGTSSIARTPRGDFKFTRHIDGLRISYLGVLYKPWYFTGGYALHGSPSVPSYPASHGCIRMPNWEADWMDGHLFVGMPFHVYD
jgi:peptidoglycan hydrolase-like protein with peptidoglycan-binding domain